MAPDVHAALTDIVAASMAVSTATPPSDYLAALQRDRRYRLTSTEADRVGREDYDPDRSRDLSQPLEKLGPDETLKANSDYLRGTIEQSLVDDITAVGDGRTTPS